MSAPEPWSDREHAAAGPTRVRFEVLGWMATAAASAYLSRTCIATASDTIRADFQLSSREMGTVMAMFAIGYSLGQIPLGGVVSWLGTRRTLTALSVIWSLVTLSGSLCGNGLALGATRLLFGTAQAGMVPSIAKGLSHWFPEGRRGTASAAVGTSMQVGAMAAAWLSPFALVAFGWRGMFAIYALVGLGWAVGFWFAYRETPAEDPRTNAAERDLIARATVPGDGQAAAVPPAGRRAVLRAALAHRNLWLICAQSFFRAFGYAFFVTWYFSFLTRAYGMDVRQAGYSSLLTLIAGLAGTLLAGALLDAVWRATGSKWWSRSATAAATLLLCAACTLGASLATSPAVAVAIIAAGLFFSMFSGPASWAGTMDISGRHTAVVFGAMNAVGAAGEALSAIVVGALFDLIERSGGDYFPVFALFALVYVCAAISWLALDPSRRIVPDAG
jgi:sugar phosphate permease